MTMKGRAVVLPVPLNRPTLVCRHLAAAQMLPLVSTDETFLVNKAVINPLVPTVTLSYKWSNVVDMH